MALSKQDLQGARTAADVERKYNFGKTFKEVFNLANEAKEAAEEAQKLDEDLTAEEIFNRLTNNGEAQGIYRNPADGKIYINLEYLVSEFISANLVRAGILQSEDGKVKIDLNTGEITCEGEYGTVKIKEGFITLENIEDGGGVEVGQNLFGGGHVYLTDGVDNYGLTLLQGILFANLIDLDNADYPVVSERIGFKTVNGVRTIVSVDENMESGESTASGAIREFDSGAISVSSYTHNGIDSKFYMLTLKVTDQSDRVSYYTTSVTYRAIRYLNSQVLSWVVPFSSGYATLKATLVRTGSVSMTFSVDSFSGVDDVKIAYVEGFN